MYLSPMLGDGRDLVDLIIQTSVVAPHYREGSCNRLADPQR
jgi:hypothetical protein